MSEPGTELDIADGVDEGKETRQNQNMAGNNRGPLLIVAAIVGIGVLLTVILVPLSFSGLEFYEFGFRRRETTGTVDKSKVYAGGLHCIGPDFKFKKFLASAHFIKFSKVRVFASDRLQVHITANLQYFLRQDQLVLLHEKYDIRYQAILQTNALDALKGAATVFSTREFIHDRDNVESHLFKAVKERLGGTCCEKVCEKGRCMRGCKPYDKCTEADFGLFVNVRYFQLHELEIPDELNQRFLQSLILKEATLSEQLRQDALIIRKETDALAKQKENAAIEIRQNATALSSLAMSRAQAEAKATIEKARSHGLRHLYTELNLNAQDQKMTYDYLRTLRQQNKVKLAVDYNSLVSMGRSEL